MPSREPNWECPECGYKVWAEFEGTVDFSVHIGCPLCPSWMHRLDRLGEIEKELERG